GEEGKTMLERVIEHKDKGRSADYALHTEKQQRLFADVQDVVDKVHSEIGHGRGRWDLAKIYMRG
ncbi:hypothetical protein ACFQ3O_01270, partial [Alkalibacillus flavidus]